MEYVAMLNEPDLVKGLEELLQDNEVTVVKRTIRVFANVYRYALELLATGELEYDVYKAAWPAVHSVADALIEMIPNTENEGVLIHLVRFLEAGIVSHLLSDISRYSDMVTECEVVLTKAIESLKSLVTAPYVAGSVYIVGIRALISVACYKIDMKPEVIQLIKQQIKSPPATLFDHNVRSFHKILQKNLFRLLKRSDEPKEKDILIEMMVTVGVNRKLLAPYITRPRKRPPPNTSSNLMDKIMFPPAKRSRSKSKSPPSSGRSSPLEPIITSPSSSIQEENTNVTKSESDTLFETLQAATSKFKVKNKDKDKENKDTPLKLPDIKANIDLLKSIIEDSAKNILKQTELFSLLNQKTVVDIIIANIDLTPESPPENLSNLFKSEGIEIKDSIEVMKQRSAKLLSQLISDEEFKVVLKKKNSPPMDTPKSPSPPIAPSQQNTISEEVKVVNSPKKNPFGDILGQGDTDMRTLVGRKDIDMRRNNPINRSRENSRSPQIDSRSPTHSPPLVYQNNIDPSRINMSPPLSDSIGSNKLPSRADPRLASRTDPRTQSTRIDPRLSSIEQSTSNAIGGRLSPPGAVLRRDPRMTSNRVDPRMVSNNTDPRVASSNNTDPRMSSNNSDPRNSINSDPRMMSNNVDPRMGSLNSDPRMTSNIDPRIGSNTDPRMASNIDPRVSSNNDPRMTSNIDPRMVSNSIDHRMAIDSDYNDHRRRQDPRNPTTRIDPRLNNVSNHRSTPSPPFRRDPRSNDYNHRSSPPTNSDPRMNSFNPNSSMNNDPRARHPAEDISNQYHGNRFSNQNSDKFYNSQNENRFYQESNPWLNYVPEKQLPHQMNSNEPNNQPRGILGNAPRNYPNQMPNNMNHQYMNENMNNSFNNRGNNRDPRNQNGAGSTNMYQEQLNSRMHPNNDPRSLYSNPSSVLHM